MAEILVVSKDRPVPEGPGRWKEGECVMARPDGWQWGRQELNKEKFVRVRVPGVSVEAVQEFMEEHLAPESTEADPVRLHRRRFLLPPGIMTALKNAPDGVLDRALNVLVAQRIDRANG